MTPQDDIRKDVRRSSCPRPTSDHSNAIGGGIRRKFGLAREAGWKAGEFGLAREAGGNPAEIRLGKRRRSQSAGMVVAGLRPASGAGSVAEIGTNAGVDGRRVSGTE
jgi:hypothetical protein